MINKLKLYKIELLIVLLVVFFQSTQFFSPENRYFIVGNLDVFFFISVFLLIYTRKKIFLYLDKIVKNLIILLFIMIIQLAALPSLSIASAIICSLKLILCFNLFTIIANKNLKFDIEKVVVGISIIYLILLILSITNIDSNILWRHNDYVNVFNETRLQFLYSEPSELGFFSMMNLIVIVSIIFARKIAIKTQYIFIVIVNTAVLFYTKSMGAILVGVIVLLFIIISWFICNLDRKSVIFATVIIMFLLLLGYYLIYSENSLYLRIISMLSGNDSSFRYRINSSYGSAITSLKYSKLIGLGAGNANSQFALELFKKYSILANAGIVATFANIIAEFGIFGIAFLVYIVKKYFSRFIKLELWCKAIILYLLFYMCIGTHMTNGIIYAIFAVVLFNKNNLAEKG